MTTYPSKGHHITSLPSHLTSYRALYVLKNQSICELDHMTLLPLVQASPSLSHTGPQSPTHSHRFWSLPLEFTMCCQAAFSEMTGLDTSQPRETTLWLPTACRTKSEPLSTVPRPATWAPLCISVSPPPPSPASPDSQF